MATLYVTEPGARVEKEYQRILVTREDEVLLSVPLVHVSEVVLVGWAGVTTPAMLSLLDRGVGFSMITRGGKLRGRLRPPEAHNLPLRQTQYRAGEDMDFCLALAKSIVAGKVANSRSMAGRIARRSRFEKMKLGRLKAVLDGADERIQAAQSLDTLRGVEGGAARAYFAILRSALHWPEDLPARRTRRPPRDPVNAMLSLGYSLLTNAMFSACEVVGLDPYDGFFHADAYGRPGLALDLVEEFRVPVVDSLVLTLVNKRMLTPNEFEADDEGPGVWLTEKGRKVFFSQFSRRLQTAILHARAGRAISYQKCLEVQARELRKLLEGERDSYTPFRIR